MIIQPPRSTDYFKPKSAVPAVEETPVKEPSKAWQRIRPVLFPVATFVIICAAMEGVVRAKLVQDFVLPPPSEVIKSLFEKETDLWHGLRQTALAALAGFGASALLGVIFAVLLSSSRIIKESFYPYAVFFQTVPIIAIAPMLTIWIDSPFRIVMVTACIASIFPIIANTYSGLTSTDPALKDLFKLYGAKPMNSLIKLRLPWALPSILTGLRVAAGLAVIGAMVGEFIAGGGLGSVIEASKTQQHNERVFAAVLLASVMGLVLFAMINTISHYALRHWHASEKEV